MDPRVVAVVGGEVIVRSRQRALTPSGERFDAPVLGVYRVRGGLFASAEMFDFDRSPSSTSCAGQAPRPTM